MTTSLNEEKNPFSCFRLYNVKYLRYNSDIWFWIIYFKISLNYVILYF